MRFSIFHVPTSLGPEDDANVIQMMLQQSLLADELGFSAIMLPEHHFTSYSPPGSDPMMFAAYLAPQLKQAYLGFAIVVAPIWNPVRMVERINLLDQLTQGRSVFGVGSGFHPVEFAGLGLHPTDAKSGLTDENMQVAMDLWNMKRGDTYSYKNSRYEGTVIDRVMPAPLTQPHPFLMGTSATEAGTRRAAKNGWGIFYLGSPAKMDELLKRVRLYVEELGAAGHAPDVVEKCLAWSATHTILTVCAPTDEEANAIADLHLQGHKENLDRQLAWIHAAQDATGIPRQEGNRFSPLSPHFRNDICLIGSPDTLAKKLQPLADAGIGLANMSFNLGMGFTPERQKHVTDSMTLFAKEVMPRFKDSKVPKTVGEINFDHVSAGLAEDIVVKEVL